MESTGPNARQVFLFGPSERCSDVARERTREQRIGIKSYGNDQSITKLLMERKIYHQRTTTTQVVVDVGTQGAVVSKTTKGCIQKCSPWTAGWMDSGTTVLFLNPWFDSTQSLYHIYMSITIRMTLDLFLEFLLGRDVFWAIGMIQSSFASVDPSFVSSTHPECSE